MITLVAINAKYIHCPIGHRSIFANMGHLRKHTRMIEFDIRRRPFEIVEKLQQIIKNTPSIPTILGFGVYIWNIAIITEVIGLLRQLYPQNSPTNPLTIILGGPEVSFPDDLPSVAQMADYVICGEGEVSFPHLCQKITENLPVPDVSNTNGSNIIVSDPPDLSKLALPYPYYTEDDIAHRIVYVEASRGCPFGCEFCLSSLDKTVRKFDRKQFFAAIIDLIRRGARSFKFTDRSFNTDLDLAEQILTFFLQKIEAGDSYFLHFEVIPWLLPERLKSLLTRFPAGAIQLEMGIQSLCPEVLERISRSTASIAPAQLRQAEENIRWLRQSTGVHVHADLIAGLPGENLQSFAAGFNRLFSWHPQEIQLGVLKRLRGARIRRHTKPFQMVYSPYSPYEILQTKDVSFEEMCKIKHFARFWDIIANSGKYPHLFNLLIADEKDVFSRFMHCALWLLENLGGQSGIAAPRLARGLGDYLVEHINVPSEEVDKAIEADLSAKKETRSSSGHHERQQRRIQ